MIAGGENLSLKHYIKRDWEICMLVIELAPYIDLLAAIHGNFSLFLPTIINRVSHVSLVPKQFLFTSSLVYRWILC